MTKNAAMKREARQYMQDHDVPYTVALRRVRHLKVGDRVREIPGEGDIKQMPIGVVDEVLVARDGGLRYNVDYQIGRPSIGLDRSDLEAVTI